MTTNTASIAEPSSSVDLTLTRPSDCLMTPDQYRNAIKKLGMSQAKAGEFLGVSLRTSQGYALGEYPIPEGFAKLLRLMVRLKLRPEDIQ